MAFGAPDPYRQAIRNSLAMAWSVTASRAGVPVAGATGLAPTGGSVDDDANRDGRRTLSLELAAAPGLFDLLKPTGTLLTVTTVVTYLNGRTAQVPMGVFDIDGQNSGEINDTIKITAPDKWVRVKRARFLKPQASVPSLTIPEQIAVLIRGALGAGEPVVITASSTVKVGAVIWDQDRDKAILDLAKSIGAWVYFDRYGVATVADRPILGFTSDWTIDASKSGVLTSLDRERSRERTFNVVVARSSNSSGDALFVPQIVWDSDPLSPTYAGTDPINSPELAGPFRVVPYFFESPLLKTADQAKAAARTVLATTVGLASQVSLGSVPNPAVDSGDVIDVLPPQERYDIPRAFERHMVDKVTHPLSMQETRIQGRSTRTDDYT